MDEYKTSDLPLIGMLAISFPIKSVDKEDRRRVQFIFDKSPELDQMVMDFYNHKLMCDPKIYWEKIRDLKELIYNS